MPLDLHRFRRDLPPNAAELPPAQLLFIAEHQALVGWMELQPKRAKCSGRGRPGALLDRVTGELTANEEPIWRRRNRHSKSASHG